jgi:hypothetical protein
VASYQVMVSTYQFPDLLAVDHVVIGLALAELERRWHIASLAVDAGAEPAEIDDDTLDWWRAAYRRYMDGPMCVSRLRRPAPAVIALPTADRTGRSPAA